MIMTAYYDEIVTIVREYLGPAADRFVKRQIEFHCEHSPENITKEDVERLSHSVGTALSLLTQDKNMVKEAENKINKIL